MSNFIDERALSWETQDLCVGFGLRVDLAKRITFSGRIEMLHG